ncbi:hypothetical protein COU17_02500 [Candidatus Kaiserbacteria bacterium CG10_big_fil_rev_8_21_14_0_10_49_17]|uniref:DoxX family protein n=1 Tax=Candidatus Kaiserbacteria bacterium CG10_big_fil_rev_8_21_14_0_10_49_17 TaxID=1974609 RepID=A0A2M6WDZ2_9BACT|nr:MAG: hypothetical protein COU17_02500 [Candidatus Kaiserbacteria bacterium CG10_big_fil_rev_8_21_14_0_10_49_17]
MENKKVEWLLRAGVAFAFLYPAISAVFNPFAWIGYFPVFLTSLAGEHTDWLLHLFGLSEVIIALWILIGKRIFIPASLASIYLIGIILFNIPQMDVIFRDISILAMSLALAVSYMPRKEITREAV